MEHHVAYAFAENKVTASLGLTKVMEMLMEHLCNTGFKPAFLMIKQSNCIQEWLMWDNKRVTNSMTKMYN